MDRVTEEELSAIAARCRDAAPGPRRSFVEGRETAGEDLELVGASAADQDFLASARGDVIRLAAEVRRLRSLVGTSTDQASPAAGPERQGVALSMPMPSSVEATFAQVRWPDAELEQIVIDYDAFSLWVKESNGAVQVLRLQGYIAHSIVGVWDEMIIASADVGHDGPLLSAAVEAVRQRAHVDSGSAARNARDWRVARVRFIDGSTLHVVAAAAVRARADE